jgi:hypothetical protein
MLVVLDIDRAVLSAEAKRLAATDTGGPSVEVIDPPTWRVLQRMQASGVLQLVGDSARILHQALQPTESDEAARLAMARAAELRSQAERALRKAQVLAAGGFPEEAPALLLKAIGHGGAARLAQLGELPTDSCAATPAQIRDLVDRNALPLQLLATFDTALSGAPSGIELERLLKTTAEAIASCFECTNALNSI